MWAKNAFEKLTALSIPTKVSINDRQEEEYLHHFEKSELLVDRRDLKIKGPLVGVLSAHLSHVGQDIIVLACDMTHIGLFVLEKLLKEYREHQPEAISFKGENIEPLCGIYSSHSLQKIRAKYDAGTFKSYSMTAVLESLKTTYLPISEEWRPLFKSYNSPNDVA